MTFPGSRPTDDLHLQAFPSSRRQPANLAAARPPPFPGRVRLGRQRGADRGPRRPDPHHRRPHRRRPAQCRADGSQRLPEDGHPLRHGLRPGARQLPCSRPALDRPVDDLDARDREPDHRPDRRLARGLGADPLPTGDRCAVAPDRGSADLDHAGGAPERPGGLRPRRRRHGHASRPGPGQLPRDGHSADDRLDALSPRRHAADGECRRLAHPGHGHHHLRARQRGARRDRHRPSQLVPSASSR